MVKMELKILVDSSIFGLINVPISPFLLPRKKILFNSVALSHFVDNSKCSFFFYTVLPNLPVLNFPLTQIKPVVFWYLFEVGWLVGLLVQGFLVILVFFLGQFFFFFFFRLYSVSFVPVTSNWSSSIWSNNIWEKYLILYSYK